MTNDARGESAASTSSLPSTTLRTEVDDERVLVTLEGEVDLEIASWWDGGTADLPVHGRSLVVDASAVDFIDPSGLGLLVKLRGLHPTMRLRDPSPAVLRLIEATGTGSLLDGAGGADGAAHPR